MLFPLVPNLCVPSDFSNPFPLWAVSTTVCGTLLLLQVLLLIRASAGAPVALPRRWMRWARPLVLFLSAGIMLGAVGLAVWMWLQSSAFVPWCSFGGERLAAQVTAYQAGEWGMPITVTVTALLLLLGLTLVLLSRWSWRRPQRVA